MKTHFEQDLNDLKARLLTMASQAETAVHQAVDAVVNRSDALVEQARATEAAIDALELEIDESSIHLLAKAPLATDLRLITVTMRISQNLERIGDEACKIAKRARDLNHEAPLKQVAEIPPLSAKALEMLRNSLDCFVHADSEGARALIPRDKEIDALNKQVHQHLALQMAEARDTIGPALNLMVVAKSLERIADHAKNIAEETVFLYEAEDIRHRKKAMTDATTGGL
jgi:phosphate transport system protein